MDRRRSETHARTEFHDRSSLLDNNSNENRNKTRRDHDITMAGSYNNREVACYLHGPIEETVD